MYTLLKEATSHQSINIILNKKDLSGDFSEWFHQSLKGKKASRINSANSTFQQIASQNIDQLIGSLERFSQKRVVCGLAHEMGERVVKIFGSREEVRLSQSNCPIQKDNSACGHPELSGLAQTIFLAESLLNNRHYRKGELLIGQIVVLDEQVGSLPDSGRNHKDPITKEQADISLRLNQYTQELTDSVKAYRDGM